MCTFKESDWKLFRKRLPEWQENYMEKLISEYKNLLEKEMDASEKFWTLEKRIKRDKKKSGVIVEEMSRSTMDIHILNLLHEGAITLDDLDGFSENAVKYFRSRVS